MIVRNMIPVLMVFDRLATVPARFVVPLRRRPLATIFVNFGGIIPVSMDLHRTTTDLATLVVPSALFVVRRHITPVLVDMDISAAVPT
jgi:hypothetical protein